MELEISIFLLIVVIVFNILLVRYIRRQTVFSNSKKLHEILLLNNNYSFNNDIRSKYNYHIKKKTLAQARDTDTNTIIISFIEENFEEMKKLYLDVKANECLYNEYNRKFADIMNAPSMCDENYFLLSKTAFSELEESICKHSKKSTVTSPRFDMLISYRSPKGKSRYSYETTISFGEFAEYIGIIIEKINAKKSKEYQRKAMTPSLRYDILKRDNYRCTICGRSAKDGITLHIDHIIPVSKGGLTEKGNLRTLCNECNIGKRDKYDPYGIN